ncbi:MAG: RHS repeat-associated core domain-containing protein [Terriglobales bacterium]
MHEASRLTKLVIVTPNNIRFAWSRVRQSRRSNATSSVTEITKINNRVYTRCFDGNRNEVRLVSPANRRFITGMDQFGRVTRVAQPGLFPINVSYDDCGRTSQIMWGSGEQSRSFVFTYHSRGVSACNALGQTVVLQFDDFGRLTSKTFADGREFQMSYDSSGNLRSVSLDGSQTKLIEYNEAKLPTSVDCAPSVGTALTTYSYNADKQVITVLRAPDVLIHYDYDRTGVLTSIKTPTREVHFAYDPTTRMLLNVRTSDGTSIAYEYDGSILTRLTWDGRVKGLVARTYDNDFRISSRTVNDVDKTECSYDADGLLIRSGELTVTRDRASGFIRSSKLINTVTEYDYTGFGELSKLSAKFADSELFRAEYSYDKASRIMRVSEQVLGRNVTREYSYDVFARLAESNTDGVINLRYEYDSHGNRVCCERNGDRDLCHYDQADRILQWGEVTFAHSLAGQIERKAVGAETSTYTYDAFGCLMSVRTSTGVCVEYILDGWGRRIGKKVNGHLVEGFLYKNGVAPIAELDGDNYVVSRFVYATKPHAPDYIQKGGALYRVWSDRLGSPRLVAHAVTGEIVQELEYDDFGGILKDTNPGFQPFGFGGGIFEPETGLLHFGCREYDPRIGRWTTPDPIAFRIVDQNLYVYAKNDPVNRIDPTGQLSCTYYQDTGHLVCTDDAGNTVVDGSGYSGHGIGINNPDQDGVKDTGPIPGGDWNVRPCINDPGGLGPTVCPIDPLPWTDTKNRGGFYVHGDNSSENQSASEGCIIMPPDVRQVINNAGGAGLTVQPHDPMSKYPPAPTGEPFY